MKRKVFLLFPPGWTLTTGSPHLAVPLLKSFLEAHEVDVIARDVNFDFSCSIGVHLNAKSAGSGCVGESLDKMNEVYFEAEDRLSQVASNYGGEWNAQLGFSYNDSPERSSQSSHDALFRSSPFDNYHRTQLIPEIFRFDPHIIGFCLAAVQQLVPTLQLAKQLRDSGYSGLIILGGNTVSRLAKEMSLDWIFDLIDGLITFQGEIPLLSLCKAIQTNDSLDRVPGLIWRDSSGLIRQNSERAPISPDLVNAPDYSDLSTGKYWGSNYLNLMAARGCYYGKCDFCAIPYGWGSSGYGGVRSVEHVCQDIASLVHRFGIRRFKFVDEALSPAFMRALSNELIRGNIDIEWEGYVRFESAWYDKEFVRNVAAAGFRKGYFGLEVLPSRSRSALNKHDCPQPNILLPLCSDYGVKVHFFCMFGFPGTGRPEAEETTNYLIKNKHLIDTADIFPWTYVKHTKVPGVEPVYAKDMDWSLELDYKSSRSDVMVKESIFDLASEFEEALWENTPRFLHPLYRLVSPWHLNALSTTSVADISIPISSF